MKWTKIKVVEDLVVGDLMKLTTYSTNVVMWLGMEPNTNLGFILDKNNIDTMCICGGCLASCKVYKED